MKFDEMIKDIGSRKNFFRGPTSHVQDFATKPDWKPSFSDEKKSAELEGKVNVSIMNDKAAKRKVFFDKAHITNTELLDAIETLYDLVTDNHPDIAKAVAQKILSKYGEVK